MIPGPVRAATSAALIVLAACADSPAGPRSDVSEMDLLGVVLASSAGSHPNGATACPGGGEMIRGGTSDFSKVGDIATLTFDTSLEFRSCRHVVANRTFTLDGESRSTGQIQSRVPPGGPAEVIAAFYRQVGTHRWQGDGQERSCAIDLTYAFDPAARHYTVAGMVCGRALSLTLPV